MNDAAKQLKKFHLYIEEQLSSFDRTEFCSPLVFREGARVAFWWVMPAMAAVWFITRYKEHLPFAYLDAAISEGIGSHLWTVVGMLGLALLGLAILLPRCKFVADSAYQILVNTCAMGWLACGLLFGLLIARVPAELAKLAAWKAWLLEAGLATLMLEVFVLNCWIWWLGNLMRSGGSDGGFLRGVELLDLRLRFAAFVFLSVLPIGLFVIRGK